MGQSNVCYPLEKDLSPKHAPWMKRAVDYVRSYSGPNLLTNAVADAHDEIAADAERALGRAQGRRVPNPKERKALEDPGVKKGMAYFANQGFDVENVGAKTSYDICCTKDGRELCVQVKTTTTSGEQVILTPREAELKGERALFVVHSVQLVRGKPRGGTVRVILPWKIENKRLKAISYMYNVPQA